MMAIGSVDAGIEKKITRSNTQPKAKFITHD